MQVDVVVVVMLLLCPNYGKYLPQDETEGASSAPHNKRTESFSNFG